MVTIARTHEFNCPPPFFPTEAKKEMFGTYKRPGCYSKTRYLSLISIHSNTSKEQ